ncbi:hypothetical protein ACFL3Q_14315 [Planctomycetota bacterium]
MSNLSRGKFAQAISDRSGQAFPYSEMVTEWNGSFVHYSEFEPKHPQLEPRRFTADGQGLPKARPARVEPATPNLLQSNPFTITSGSGIISVFEPSHGRSTADVVVFRNVDGSPGGLSYSVFEDSNGYAITVIDTNNYTFNLGSTPTVSGKFGGMTVTAGPVTLTP